VEPDLVGDDVALRSAGIVPTVTTAGSNGSFSRDDRLEREDRPSRDDDRVDRVLGRGAVTAAAEDRDVDGVGVGPRIARRVSDLSGREALVVVERDREEPAPR
jgi:hypothetical protein